MQLKIISLTIMKSSEPQDRIVDSQSLTLGGKHVNQIFTRPKGNKPR